MDGVPLLILANKSDLANTKSIDQIIDLKTNITIPKTNSPIRVIIDEEKKPKAKTASFIESRWFRTLINRFGIDIEEVRGPKHNVP